MSVSPIRWLALLAATVLLVPAWPALARDAEPAAEDLKPTEAIVTLAGIERRLAKETLEPEELDRLFQQVRLLETQGAACVASAQAELERLAETLTVLGEAQKGESRELAGQRRSLTARKAQLDKQQAECRLVAIHAEELGRQTAESRRRLLAQRLGLRGPGLASQVQSALAAGEELLAVLPWAEASPWAWLWKTAGGLLLGLGLALGGTGVGLPLRYRLRGPLTSAVERVTVGVVCNLVVASWHALPRLLAVGGLALGLALKTAGPLGSVLVRSALILVAGLALVRVLFSFSPPWQQLMPVEERVGRQLRRRARLVVAMAVPVQALAGLAALEAGPLLQLAATLVGMLLAASLAALVWTSVQVGGRLWRLGGRWLAGILLLFVLFAEGAGYHNLTSHVLRAALGSLLLAAGLWIGLRLLEELGAGPEQAGVAWQRRLADLVGAEPGPMVSALGWLRLVGQGLLWLVLALGLLRAWGLSEAYYATVVGFLADGFTVGGVQLVPARLAVGLALFLLVWLSSRWLRHNLEHRWLAPAQFGPGVRELVVTMTGYLGFVLACLLGLSAAGVDLSQLAIILGALSVGIGFGLQNIVNNLVSGLILLFERPIKRGDWIVVGGTEGLVKKISVRSTVIQTFDRAEVIVPNSELIANQVTNWTLEDAVGRICLPVGVAYGSDTALVQRLLLEVGAGHPEVLTSPAATPPQVLFMSFGDNALNFELRCFVRHVGQRPAVVSDLNFAVDQAFREHGIEIPFPQRDLHIRDWRGPGPT
ncbi:MAG: mechanosensitive ion channel domain-containing protein [Thermodesulfobacteriota bacterium]